MAKPYVFWRASDGRPTRGPTDKSAPRQLLKEIGLGSKIDSAGSVSFEGLMYNRYFAAIEKRVVIIGPDDRELNPIDTGRIMSQAIDEAVKETGAATPLSSGQVLQAANAKAAAFFRKQPSPFVLLSGINIAQSPVKSNVLRVEGHVIKFVQKYKPKFANSLEAIKHALPKHDRPSEAGYQLLEIETKGRSEAEAAENALDSLNLLCGLWTFFGEYRSYTITLGALPPPIGVLRIGPIHVLCRPEGKIASDLIWYDRHYIPDGKLYAPNRGWSKVDESRQKAMQVMRRLKYRRECETLVRRYSIAMEHSDVDVVFLHLWSLLEKITNTVGAKYDVTIKKATWGFDDTKLAREQLEAVRVRRNELVHAAKSGQSDTGLVYILKSFIDVHLRRLIWNELEVESVEEYSERLGLSLNLKALQKRQKAARIALEYAKSYERRKMK